MEHKTISCSIISRKISLRGALGTGQTSELALAGAKRVNLRGTTLQRVYIDSYVKRWLMSPA